MTPVLRRTGVDCDAMRCDAVPSKAKPVGLLRWLPELSLTDSTLAPSGALSSCGAGGVRKPPRTNRAQPTPSACRVSAHDFLQGAAPTLCYAGGLAV